MNSSLTLNWHGHSCFTIAAGGRILALDPYDASMIGYPPLHIEAHAMLASHQHGDHNYMQAVRFLPMEGSCLQWADPAAGLPAPQLPGHFYCQAVETAHDETGGKKRGQNKVHIIRTAGLTIAHLGDLGHIPNPAQAAAIGQPDLLMIPVGGYYTIDAAAAREVVRLLRPANVVPMHYKLDFGILPITGVEPFLRLMADDWDIVRLDSPSLELDSRMRGKCFVFPYQAGK